MIYIYIHIHVCDTYIYACVVYMYIYITRNPQWFVIGRFDLHDYHPEFLLMPGILQDTTPHPEPFLISN